MGNIHNTVAARQPGDAINKNTTVTASPLTVTASRRLKRISTASPAKTLDQYAKVIP